MIFLELRELRRYVRSRLLSEIKADMVSRLVGISTYVTGRSYEGSRYISALNTEALRRGEIKVEGTIKIDPIMPTHLANGQVVKPWLVDQFTAESPAVSVALMGIALSTHKVLVPSKHISPAARKFLYSYYEKNKNDPSKMSRIVPKGKFKDFFEREFDQDDPALSSAYLDAFDLDTNAIFERGKSLLKQCAKLRGVKLKDLNDDVFNEQEDAFGRAYTSLQSGREDVKLAMSGGEITVAKLDAALHTNNFHRLRDMINELPAPAPADIQAWLEEHDSTLRTFKIVGQELPG